MRVREGFVESEGHRLAYLAVNEHLTEQDEPRLVFIHGVLASVNFWGECVPPSFRSDRAWYSLSLPAHHPSTVPADFSAEQVDSAWFHRVMSGALKALLGDEKAIVIGHSTGGFSALNLAIHRAPNVAGVISIAGFHSGRWEGIEGQLVRVAGLGPWARGLFHASIVTAQRSELVRRFSAALLAHRRRGFWASPRGARLLRAFQDDARRQDPRALYMLFRGIGRLEIADELHRIDVPCQLLVGTHDPVVPGAQSLLLAGRIRHAEVIALREVGHMPFVEAFDEYAEALERALRSITAQREPAHPRQAETRSQP